MGRRGLVIVGHGARDARWAEPFERLRARVQHREPAIEVRLAYLELMPPDLPTSVAELVSAGVQAIRVAPVFFGQGAHIRNDLASLVTVLRGRYPQVDIRCAAPAGEDPSVVDALAQYCLNGLGA